MEEDNKQLEDDAIRYRKIMALVKSDLTPAIREFAVKALLSGIEADMYGFPVRLDIDDLRILRDERGMPIGFAGPEGFAYLFEEAGRTWRPL
jgi:hypothetical protein